MERQE
jgi:hypothetical protein